MIRLYGYWRSSCTWRVRVALHLKGVAHEVVPVSLVAKGGEQHDVVFAQLNPSRQVPVLTVEEHGSHQVITQSMAILAWLDRMAPSPPLFPTTAREHARAIELAEVINAGTQPLQNLSTLKALDRLGVDSTAWSRQVITRGLEAFIRLLGPSRTTYCLGESLSVADLFLVPQLYNARRFGVDLTPFGQLQAIETACLAHPAFSQTRPEMQADAPKD